MIAKKNFSLTKIRFLLHHIFQIKTGNDVELRLIRILI